MARLPFDAERLLSFASVFNQSQTAIRMLASEVERTKPGAAYGFALQVFQIWQSRFADLLRSEIPDWACLAAYRSIADFNIERPTDLEWLKDVVIGEPGTIPVPKLLPTWEEVKTAYQEYFACRNLHSGKFTLAGQPEADLLSLLDEFRATLGGQAGNILWMLDCINGNARGYVPYLSERTASIPEIGETSFLDLDSKGGRWLPLRSHIPGVLSTTQTGRPAAPSGGSFVIAQRGKRMIMELKGLRVIQSTPVPLPFDAAEYRLDGIPLAPKLPRPVPKNGEPDHVWPLVPFFARVFIEDRLLVIDILGDEPLRAALHPDGVLEIQQAVMGGLNAVFYGDPWLNQDAALRLRLAGLVEQQIRCLRACGIRVGAELSGKPDRNYSEMLKRLCADGTIVSLGINGEDELPEITDFTTQVKDDGRDEIPPVSYDYYLAPDEIPRELRSARNDKAAPGFPYLTYLRARKFAAALGVRTLYVHTNSIDMVLRRNADPGSLQSAQRAAFMGKGLVIASLMKRSYPADWAAKLPDIPFAVNPEAMVSLWHFANHFNRFRAPGSFESLLTSGLWVNPNDDDYSLALLPVLWPALEDRKKMPPELNTTGAGDMTFGVFFYLGGV